MKPFTFKLQSALDLKLKQEEQQKEFMGKLQRSYQEQMELLNRFEERLLYLQNQLRKQQRNSIELDKIRSYEEYLPILHGKIEDQSAQVERILAEIHKAREVLVALMQERKVLEKLRLKKLQEYQKQVLLEEQKHIDEMATNSFLNKEIPQV